MRSLLLGLCFVGALAGSAAAVNNDIVELGLGVRYLFDSDYYAADNPGVNYNSDFFPLAGDHALGLGLYGAIGHRFDSRKGPWEFLIKYYYTRGFEDADVPFTMVSGQSTVNLQSTARLDQHDLLFTFRLPGGSDLIPVPLLSSPSLYYDLGFGVSTLAYDYELSSVVGGVSVPVASSVRTRSGMAVNFGMGWRHELSETLELNLRGDLIFSSIQNVEDADGKLVHFSPNAHNIKLAIGLTKRFDARF